MSRGIRDLRDLICVSRLTIRESDDEMFSSDDDGGGNSTGRPSKLSRKLSRTSLSSQTSRESSAAKHRDAPPSPDSGISSTNNQSPQESQENVRQSASESTTHVRIPHPPPKVDDSIPRAFRKKKKTKKKRKVELDPTIPSDIPKAAPLPHISQRTVRRPSSSSSVDSDKAVSARPSYGRLNSQRKPDPGPSVPHKEGNFDEMLTFIDATLLSEWLQQANGNVTNLATFCHAGENFVQFAHFWLSEFPDYQKHEIFKLESSIIVDNLNFAFALGREAGVVKHRDVQKFMDAVFREYPGKLLSVKGPHLFLDYLDVLSSERQDAYKKVLSDVKCSTRVKSHAQWTLGIRSYTLVSIWTAVINFYRKFMREARGRKPIAQPVHISAVNKNDPYEVRMYQAIRNGYADVVNYLLRSGQIKATMTDLDNKGLIFTAVVHNQPKVLSYLLKHVRPKLDINIAANTGNTPLHAAANNGNVEIAAILVAEPGINVNATNPQCDNATPLHLAVMHGHVSVVEVLMKAGANANMKMGDVSALDIAKDFGHFTVYNLLDNNRNDAQITENG